MRTEQLTSCFEPLQKGRNDSREVTSTNLSAYVERISRLKSLC